MKSTAPLTDHELLTLRNLCRDEANRYPGSQEHVNKFVDLANKCDLARTDIEEWLSRPCPTCNVHAGSYCISTKGKIYITDKPHSSRKEVASRPDRT